MARSRTGNLESLGSLRWTTCTGGRPRALEDVVGDAAERGRGRSVRRRRAPAATPDSRMRRGGGRALEHGCTGRFGLVFWAYIDYPLGQPTHSGPTSQRSHGVPGPRGGHATVAKCQLSVSSIKSLPPRSLQTTRITVCVF